MSTGRCLCDTLEDHPASECIPSWRTPTEVQQEDVRLILDALGLPTSARPYSPHAVVHRDILPAIDDLRDAPRVCIAHGEPAPCHHEGGHRETANPYWVKAVADYRGSAIVGLTWEPAWERSASSQRLAEYNRRDEAQVAELRHRTNQWGDPL